MTSVKNPPTLDATETTAGKVELATSAETLAGTSTTTVMTPASFAANKSNSQNGYYKLPSGLTLQWGRKTSAGLSGAVSFPIAFASACYSVTLTAVETGASPRYAGLTGIPSTTGFNYATQSSDVDDVFWQAIGV